MAILLYIGIFLFSMFVTFSLQHFINKSWISIIITWPIIVVFLYMGETSSVGYIDPFFFLGIFIIMPAIVIGSFVGAGIYYKYNRSEDEDDPT